MITAPRDENLYIRVICIESNEFIDPSIIAIWGDCSVSEGEWYDAIIEGHYSLVDRDYILVRFRDGLCPYNKKMFKTESEFRDEKIQSVLNGGNSEHCYYSDLPSPWAYMEKKDH